MITVIGIGMEKGDLTRKAAEKIASAKCAYLRSQKTRAGKAILAEFPEVRPLDELFDKSENFDELVSAISNTLIDGDKKYGEVLYLTDGDGADNVTCALSKNHEISVIYGVAPSYSRAPNSHMVRISAYELLGLHPCLDTSLGLQITEIDDAYLAGEVKLFLMRYYDDLTPVTLALGGKASTVPLCEIDRARGYDYSAELYIPGSDGLYKEKYCFGDLCRIMEKLTAPDGCPWDKVQTHESIRINLIEEAYEAVDAIDSGDYDAMIEEFGDVMLQAVFHCDIAERTGEFTQGDVLTALCRKLVSRHTHIFGSDRAVDAGEALKYWEAAKAEEKSYVSTADKLNRLPECFPALLAAEKVYKKLQKAGVGDVKNLKNADDFARRLYKLVAEIADGGEDAEVILNKFVAEIKHEFTAAEERGDTADFYKKL